MKSLIIAAHGSRKAESNLEVKKLAETLAKKLGPVCDRVVPAFLQLADPLLADQLDALVSEGSKNIIVFPFFIGSGSHILRDIPELVEKARQQYPKVRFDLTRHLGGLDTVADLIASEVVSFTSAQQEDK